MLALVNAAARRFLDRGSSGAVDCLSWGSKDRLEVAEEDDLDRGAVGAVVCDCGGPVAIVLGDVADDDARRSPEVYHSVATINAPKILDELFADVSVSEPRQRTMETASNTHLLMEVDKGGEHTKGQTPGLVPVCCFEQIGHERGCDGCCDGWGQGKLDLSLTT